MRLSSLVERLHAIEPDANDVHIARLALLLTKVTADLKTLEEPAALQKACSNVQAKMEALHDQQLSVSEELSALAASAPCEFSPNHVWTLVRGIKVQSQILDCYLDK